MDNKICIQIWNIWRSLSYEVFTINENTISSIKTMRNIKIKFIFTKLFLKSDLYFGYT